MLIIQSLHVQINADPNAGKYLPALKCLLATRSINPDHPKCHEQGCRFKLALNKLDEPLPPNVKQVIDSCYLSKLSSKSLGECNEEYLDSHKDSAPHVHSVGRVRHILQPDADETRKKGISDLQATLKLDSISLEEAVEGLNVLDQIVAAQDPLAREAYMKAAHERWPEATAFRESS